MSFVTLPKATRGWWSYGNGTPPPTCSCPSACVIIGQVDDTELAGTIEDVGELTGVIDDE